MLRLRDALPQPSRRRFLIGAAAASGGLIVGFYLPAGATRARAEVSAANPLEAYLRVAPDGTVTVLSAHM